MKGMYLRRAFLQLSECEAIIASMPDTWGNAAVGDDDTNAKVNMGIRRSDVNLLPPHFQRLVHAKLLLASRRIESALGVSISEIEPLGILRYTAGDFFRRHVDVSVRPGAAEWATKRSVTFVVWLNSSSSYESRYGYSGGQLVFDRSSPDEIFEGEAGTLLAFRADREHEVLPVRTGARYVVASWAR